MLPAQQSLRADAGPVVAVLRLIRKPKILLQSVAEIRAQALGKVAVEIRAVHQPCAGDVVLVLTEEGHEPFEVRADGRFLVLVQHADEGQVDADAEHDVDQLERRAGKGAGRGIAAQQHRRGPGDFVRNEGNPAGRHGQVGDGIADERDGQEGDQHDRVENDRQPEDHQFVDVEEHWESRGQRQPTPRAAARADQDGDQQTDGRSAAAHQHEAVEELLGQDGGRLASCGQRLLVGGQSGGELVLHDVLQRVAAVDAEEPEHGGKQHEKESLEETGLADREEGVEGLMDQRTEGVRTGQGSDQFVEHREDQNHGGDRHQRRQRAVVFPVRALRVDLLLLPEEGHADGPVEPGADQTGQNG